MSEEIISRGELANPHLVPKTAVEALPENGVVMPWTRTTGLPLGASSNTSPLSLLRALKRRLPLALGLAIVAAGIFGTASWFLVPQAKFKAKSLLRVSAQQPQMVFKVDNQSGEDYKRYQRTQLNLLKSRNVLSAALSTEEGLSKLPTIRDEQDPLYWLQENLEAQFVGDSELMEISLSGDKPEDLKRLVNAVTRAFMDEIVNRESKLRQNRQENLRKLSKTYTEMMKTKRENIRRLAQTAGSDDRQTLVLQKQFAME